jgi:hypothetical protein
MMHLKIPAGAGTLEVEATVVETQQSPHTGRLIRQLQTEIAVPAAEVEAIRELLTAPELVDQNGDAWSGHLQSESYRDVNSNHLLTIVWDEREHLQADMVEFEGLQLRPLRYEERAEEAGIAISFRARLTEAQTEVLRGLQKRREEEGIYFRVVRHGVSDEPRQMRLGMVLWQQLDDGGTEQQITLVDEALDDAPHRFPRTLGGEPAIGRVLGAVEGFAAERDAMLDVLRANGLLDEAGVERIRKAGTEAIWQSRYRFYRVDNLADWD